MLEYQVEVLAGEEFVDQPGMMGEIFIDLKRDLLSIPAVERAVLTQDRIYHPYSGGILYVRVVGDVPMVDWIFDITVPLKFKLVPSPAAESQKP